MKDIRKIISENDENFDETNLNYYNDMLESQELDIKRRIHFILSSAKGFLKQVEEGKPITIVGDGEQRRDMIHVSDIVQANLAAAKTEKTEAFGQIFNIGTGVNYSVNQMAELIGGETTNLDPRPGEARVTLSDSSKAKELLDWQSKVNFKEWVINNK